ncbi:MAG: hypothetical protein N2450_00785 [bacterium]|nr:hypothetical protein [bacterium]
MWEETNKKKDEEINNEKNESETNKEETQRNTNEAQNEQLYSEEIDSNTTANDREIQSQTSEESSSVPDLTPVKPQFELPSYLTGQLSEKPPEKKSIETEKTPTPNVVFPPGFTPQVSIGPIEGHPLEGFGKKKIQQPELFELEPASSPNTTEQQKEEQETAFQEEQFTLTTTSSDEIADHLDATQESVSETETIQIKPEFEEYPIDSETISQEQFESPIKEEFTEPEEKEPIKTVPTLAFRSDKTAESTESGKTNGLQTAKTAQATKTGTTKTTSVKVDTKSPKTEKADQSPSRTKPREAPATVSSASRQDPNQLRGSTPRSTAEIGKNEGVIRSNLSGNVGGGPSDKSKTTSQQPASKVMQKKEVRQDRSREEKREVRPRETEDISLETLKRRVSELTPKERKILNEILSNKRISRNLNEVLEKDTLAAEKLFQWFGKTVWIIVFSCLIIALALYGLVLGEGKLTRLSLWIAGTLGVIWMLVITAGLRALMIREVTKAKLEFEEKLKLELNVRAITERLNSEIAPRIPEMMSAIKKILEKVSNR